MIENWQQRKLSGFLGKMLNNLGCFFLMLMFIFIPYVSVQADELVLKAGAGIQLINQADNLWAYGKKNIESIYKKPQAKTMLFPFPLFEARYINNKANTEYYISTLTEESGSLSLGMAKDFDELSSIEIYGFYSLISKEWKNPYLLQRDSTNAQNYGAKITYENIFKTPIVLSYRIAFIDISKDEIGKLYSDLRRNGSFHTVSIGYQQMFSKEFGIITGLSYEKGLLKGKSNSYDGYELFLGYNYQDNVLNLNGKLSVKTEQFDKIHPIFQQTRNEKIYEFSVTAIMSLKPIGLKNYSIITSGAVSRTIANIIFFDNYSVGGYIGAMYQF